VTSFPSGASVASAVWWLGTESGAIPHQSGHLAGVAACAGGESWGESLYEIEAKVMLSCGKLKVERADCGNSRRALTTTRIGGAHVADTHSTRPTYLAHLSDADYAAYLAKMQRVELLWNTDFFQKHLDGAITRLITDTRDELLCNLESHLRDHPYESPLEAAFAAWWYVETRHSEDLWIRPQVEVVCSEQTYRLDFQIIPLAYSPTFEYARLNGHPLCPKLAIELDGHDFHEKTKAQVTWRNKRDRDLQSHGWRVLHYSGSEFNADPGAVVRAVHLHALGVFSQAMRDAGFWRKDF
jgi:hypothetical protein